VSSMYRLLPLLLMALLLIGGCNNRKINALTAELEQSKNKINTLTAEHQQLLDRCGRLQNDLIQLQSAHENLKIQHVQLTEWSRQVAARFGPSLWYIGPDEKPLPYKQLKDASAPLLARELKRLFAQNNLPRFTLVKVGGDTAYVRVTDDGQLTQQMGTTGATAYLQAVTYTLTSLPTIQYVDFDFKEGDHAIPGKYSR
jgi:hypothetical protein